MMRQVREMKLSEVHHVLDYFLTAEHEFLLSMGVDPARMPDRPAWFKLLQDDFDRPLPDRKFFYVVWEFEGRPVGHSHFNEIVYGEEAYMHLHLWQPTLRKAGLGTFFVWESVKMIFDRFPLKQLYCQPYALNEAPNRTLRKIGFEFLRAYETSPGWISFPQEVNLWRLTKEDFNKRIGRELDHHDERPF